MPIYEYRCVACERTTETLQRIGDPPPAGCPHCGGELKRMVSAPAFQFKGSGWYVSDYAAKSRSSEEKGKDESEGKGKEKPAETSATSSGAAEKSSAAPPSGAAEK